MLTPKSPSREVGRTVKKRLAAMGILSLAVVCAAAMAARRAGDEASPRDLARQILDATGVKGGLVVHLGCGEGRLTAALRASDSYLVHGLDSDQRNVDTARRYLGSLGLDGTVSADRLTGKRLPYVDNLANLVVAERLGGVPRCFYPSQKWQKQLWDYGRAAVQQIRG